MAANQPFALAWLPCAKTCHPGRARQELKERPAGDILEVSVPPFLFVFTCLVLFTRFIDAYRVLYVSLSLFHECRYGLTCSLVSFAVLFSLAVSRSHSFFPRFRDGEGEDELRLPGSFRRRFCAHFFFRRLFRRGP